MPKYLRVITTSFLLATNADLRGWPTLGLTAESIHSPDEGVITARHLFARAAKAAVRDGRLALEAQPGERISAGWIAEVAIPVLRNLDAAVVFVGRHWPKTELGVAAHAHETALCLVATTNAEIVGPLVPSEREALAYLANRPTTSASAAKVHGDNGTAWNNRFERLRAQGLVCRDRVGRTWTYRLPWMAPVT